MSLSISQVKTKVAPKMRGGTINNIPNFFELCREAGGNVLQRCAPPETIRSARIENAIYSHIYNYSAPGDLRGTRSVIDIRPIGERLSDDDIAGRTPREFDIKRDRDTFVVEMLNGVKSLRLSKRINGHTVLHEMDSLTQGGTITGTGDVTDLTTNTLEKISGSASVQFGLSGATGTASIKIVKTNTVDLTTLQDVGALFHWLNFPDASKLTNIQFRWGSDSTNYWYVDITSPHDRTAFEDAAWTLQRADWVNATKIGTPDVTAINTLELVFTYTTGTALKNIRLDNITSATGRAYEAVYYADKLFKDISGTYIELPTTDSDIVNMAVDGHNIFIYELMLVIIQELGEKSVRRNANWFQEQLSGVGNIEGLYPLYNEENPIQTIPTQSTYYNFGYYGNDDVN